MAWMTTKWSCGHTGQTQQLGKSAMRYARIANEAGRKCMACWLLEQWDAKSDARRGDVYAARCIAEGRGIRIDSFERKPQAKNPLASRPARD